MQRCSSSYCWFFRFLGLSLLQSRVGFFVCLFVKRDKNILVFSKYKTNFISMRLYNGQAYIHMQLKCHLSRLGFWSRLGHLLNHAFGEVSTISPGFFSIYAKCKNSSLPSRFYHGVLVKVLWLILILHTLPVPDTSETAMTLYQNLSHGPTTTTKTCLS